jgi:site-specific recombinase XerD
MGKVSRVPPTRKKNEDCRGREHLTTEEVEKLIKAAAKAGRHGHRDATMIFIAFRHGLRATELIHMRRDQLMLDKSSVHVKRLKGSDSGTHPLTGREVRDLRRVLRETPDSEYVFTSERGGPLDRRVFGLIVQRAGQLAGLNLSVHPHMLRHSCGYYLANQGVDTRTIQAYLGHSNIQNTVRYTALAPGRFNKLWKD